MGNSVDDIMRQLNQKKPTKQHSVLHPKEKEKDQPDAKQPKPDEPVSEVKPKTADRDTSKPAVNDEPTVTNEPAVSEPVKQETPVNTQPDPADAARQERLRRPEPKEPEDKPERQEQTVPKHPDIKREKDKQPAFDELSAFEKLTFKDLFVKESSGVKYNSGYQKTVAKNLSKGIMDQMVDDLKRRHLFVRVWIGDNPFQIKETNDVFTSSTSTMRFLMLNQLQDENMSLQLARQLFLEKHPDGEKSGFNHDSVRTDERDIYALLLASKSDPTKDLLEKLEEMIYKVSALQESTHLADRRLIEQTGSIEQKLNGLNIASSLLVLERLGLTKGSLPKTTNDIKGFATQDDVLRLSDMLQNDIAVGVRRRQDTLVRDQRVRGQRPRPSTNQADDSYGR